MLKAKHLTIFKQKNEKKARIFAKVARIVELCSIFLQASVGCQLHFNQNLVLYRMQVVLGRWP